MASLSITPADVAVDFMGADQLTLIAGADINKGTAIKLDTSTGKFIKAEGDSAATAGNQRFVAANTVLTGQSLTGVRRCVVDLGKDVLTAGNFDAPVYISDTAGELTLTVGESTTATIIGYIRPATGGGASATPDKVLYVV